MITEDGLRYRITHDRPLGPDGRVREKGGRTVAEILGDVNQDSSDGFETVIATGEARCRPDEVYRKHLGRTIAMGRARHELLGRPGTGTPTV